MTRLLEGRGPRLVQPLGATNGAILPEQFTEFTNACLACGDATVNFSYTPEGNFSGYWSATSFELCQLQSREYRDTFLHKSKWLDSTVSKQSLAPSYRVILFGGAPLALRSKHAPQGHGM